MRSVLSLIAAGAATLFSTFAFAADMPIAPPPAYAPPPPADFGGWYLRGDIGFSNQSTGNLRSTNDALYNNVAVTQTSSFSSAGIYGGGVGYQFNSWFRADLTGQYRGKSTFTGLDVVTGTGPAAGFYGTDNYTATKSELLFLANAYVDLGTWWCVTPFVGAGLGTARVTVGNFTDTGDGSTGPGTNTHSLYYANAASKWNFAWAAHAGLAYKVTPSLTLELAYSYVDMGDGYTGPATAFDGVSPGGHPFKFKDITSNDVKLGIRWNFDNPPPPQPVLYRKG